MSRLIETPNTRLYAPSDVFGGTFRHACLNKCGQVMIVPDRNTPNAPERLTDGQIWRCGNCGALHEYYMAYGYGTRGALVRLLKGIHRRTEGEPTIKEFIDDK